LGDKRKKIGLFGGTFDPIHTGHLIVGEIIRDTLNLEQIIFIPAKRHPLKDNNFIADETHRYNMIQLAIKDNKYLTVSDIELESDGISYTIDTIQKFKNENTEPDTDIYFLMGMDNLNQFHLWKDPRELIKKCKVVVFSRPGFKPPERAEKYLSSIQIIQIPLLEISSTQIRNRVKNRQTIRYLVPPIVEAYIRDNKLYI
jgi:nicotinate-nucleotide adenylyltransferase